ncbi:hypothetical protein H6G98_12405 [Nostoc sp. FACHB-857]|nr:hypothetical protein [Nostoc sp. FACHB-857]
MGIGGVAEFEYEIQKSTLVNCYSGATGARHHLLPCGFRVSGTSLLTRPTQWLLCVS